MSAQDSHTPEQETKGIWALPMTAFILSVIAVFIFTCDCKSNKTAPDSHHEKTEAHH